MYPDKFQEIVFGKAPILPKGVHTNTKYAYVYQALELAGMYEWISVPLKSNQIQPVRGSVIRYISTHRLHDYKIETQKEKIDDQWWLHIRKLPVRYRQ